MADRQPDREKNPPPIAEQCPPNVVNPSIEYVSGYQDGFAAIWVGRVDRNVPQNYIEGYQAGAFDRRHQRNDRFPGEKLPRHRQRKTPRWKNIGVLSHTAVTTEPVLPPPTE